MAANECKSTFTPLEHLRLPSAPALRDEFIGRPLSSLRTPAAVIDRAGFVANCADMARRTAELGLAFRAHIKSKYRS
jgi:hypothetical protein